MEAKKQMVTLEANGNTQEFGIEHAERILKMQNNGGWKLPEDSQFKFDKDGIGLRENHRRDKGADKKGGDQQSDTASAKD